MDIEYLENGGRWNCKDSTQNIERIIKSYKAHPGWPFLEDDFLRVKEDCCAIYAACEISSKKRCQTKATLKNWQKFMELLFTTFETDLRANGFYPPLTSFEDGIDRTAPSYCGIYLIGSTNFNPITNEKYYWIKVGKANNISKRMNQYDTHSPMIYHIDFQKEDNERLAYKAEASYHDILKKIAVNTCANNAEWLMVDENTYLAICKNGFSYLNYCAKLY